jgi:hypothetical protein
MLRAAPMRSLTADVFYRIYLPLLDIYVLLEAVMEATHVCGIGNDKDAERCSGSARVKLGSHLENQLNDPRDCFVCPTP